jgi:hypothetical protein
MLDVIAKGGRVARRHKGDDMPNMASAVSKWLVGATMLSVFTGGGLNVRAVANEAVPNFAPDRGTAWIPDRPTGDDFLPPLSGPGPVMSARDHPYVPNGRGAQPTYRVADLSNPILRPWVIEKMKKANDGLHRLHARAGPVFPADAD